MAKLKKQRLDHLLVENDLAESIDQARRFIMAGIVIVDDHRIDKAGTLIDPNSVIRVKEKLPFVSRGGFKLAKAVREFSIDFKGAIVIDIGASTGGFTDVALQNGAQKVFAVDVGQAQLHRNMEIHPKVINLDKTNFRTIEFDTIGENADIMVSDVSFISLAKIIPSTVQFCQPNSQLIVLIKPQFEAERDEVGIGGIVTELSVHERVLTNTVRMTEGHGYRLQGLTPSPIKGAKGNIEYLAYFKYNGDVTINEADFKNLLMKVIYENHSDHC